MVIEIERLISLIDFAQHSAWLRTSPAFSVSKHGIFEIFENEFRNLPGVHLSLNESQDEIWLSVERLHETKPPLITNQLLGPWVKGTLNPNEKPILLETIDRASLITANNSLLLESGQKKLRSPGNPSDTVTLADYEKETEIRSLFAYYILIWSNWAEEEKLRRKTINLYSELFTLKQKLEGGIVETQLELVWGVGIGIWQYDDIEVRYPLVSRLTELTLNEKTAAVEIRPRDIDARLEVDWYASVDNPGVSNLEKAAKEFFGKATTTFSPFDRSTFEPLLRAAVTYLDANGVFWPDQVPAEDRSLPKPTNNLLVTDTWVLFARPRTNNLFVNDLENLKKAVSIDNPKNLPPSIAAVMTEPATDNQQLALPQFRGVSYYSMGGSPSDGKKVLELYFPKQSNDEQVRIVQLLQVSDGVVVQGPPGTGKTHTIANIICHYLAMGKRILVTSMREPALAVLREQLPVEIRPLAISLLTSEKEGMKQFEHSIQKIASEVQTLDRIETARYIKHKEESIDILHGKLALIDAKISDWAKINLEKIALDGEEIHPQEAAWEVVNGAGQFEWISDGLGIGPEYTPQLSDSDVIRLREARRFLGKDIDYLNATLPQLIELPSTKELLEVHQDLTHFQLLKQAVEKGDVPALASLNQETLELAQLLAKRIERWRHLRNEIIKACLSWTEAIHEQLRQGNKENLFMMLETLGAELSKVMEIRNKFIERPVVVPQEAETDSVFFDAINNLSAGKRPFGIANLFGKSEQKKQLESVRVGATKPAQASDWDHVKEYLSYLLNLRELTLRWNALAHELSIDIVPENKPEGGILAAKYYAVYLKVKEIAQEENEICNATSSVFPTWPFARSVPDNEEHLVELENALRHHLTKNRLANVWNTKERLQKVLQGRSGRIIDNIRQFLNQTLGNPDISDSAMQADWSNLTTELSRVLGLESYLITVEEICEKVIAAGAPQYAAALKTPPEGIVDRLLPDNWRNAWRLRRLTTYLESIDAFEELKKLRIDRQNIEGDLSKSYVEIVEKRTWLKLAEKSSPNIRAALQAYLNAIQKIRKGTGKRAIRYRQDARIAASQANPAVPCWIMPHYRISESLPPELGCFDLVIIDEASQSDLMALPALLRARKVLIVGDDKQVSPEGVAMEEEKIVSLMNRFLGSQVQTYRPQMSPERSIYDLFKVVFANNTVMLREHFRCVGPIIEYSKREFYNHELRPLRLATASERIDPPLVDVYVTDGYRSGDINLAEVRFIVEEIKNLIADPSMAKRSIGVVSLLANKQALETWKRLTEELGPELMERHRITCGDARTFQGKERDIMFLSMVCAPNNPGAPLTRETFDQRFNVAASRAKDRMYLVRSVELDHLSDADRLRRSLITHFTAPFGQDEAQVEELRHLCESPFERELYDELTQLGYRVIPQVRVGYYRIDMVVEGHEDARLAIECDGDRFHGPDRWADDMRRQRTLERAGWVFWRCFASTFVRRRKEVLEDLIRTISAQGIEPIGVSGNYHSVHTEHRTINTLEGYTNSKLEPEDENEEHLPY